MQDLLDLEGAQNGALLHLQRLHREIRPPLPVAGVLRRETKLQVLLRVRCVGGCAGGSACDSDGHILRREVLEDSRHGLSCAQYHPDGVCGDLHPVCVLLADHSHLFDMDQYDDIRVLEVPLEHQSGGPFQEKVLLELAQLAVLRGGETEVGGSLRTCVPKAIDSQWISRSINTHSNVNHADVHANNSFCDCEKHERSV